MKSCEVDLAVVHDIEGAGLQREVIEDVHIGLCSFGNCDHRGDGTTHIEQGVEFDGGLGRAETRPREQFRRTPSPTPSADGRVRPALRAEPPARWSGTGTPGPSPRPW